MRNDRNEEALGTLRYVHSGAGQPGTLEGIALACRHPMLWGDR